MMLVDKMKNRKLDFKLLSCKRFVRYGLIFLKKFNTIIFCAKSTLSIVCCLGSCRMYLLGDVLFSGLIKFYRGLQNGQSN